MTSTTTTTAGTVTAADTTDAGIAGTRARIDALDEQIIALVRERMTVSAAIQQARIAAGGRRVHLAREMEILARYRSELGRPGTAVAMNLLELCRGRA
ncbi:chorismate mutase [Streptomyces sp. TR06-5]|uniref:chorismate mutase n=1 Tax=unclassified Streptomyces TaxID=2593676 RepID=UPI0039A29600